MTTTFDAFLTLTVSPGSVLGYQSKIVGANPVRVTSTSTDLVTVDLGTGTDGGPSGSSTFSGGLQVGQGVLLGVGDSTQRSGSTITSGPLGTATVTLESLSSSTAYLVPKHGTGSTRTIYNVIHAKSTASTETAANLATIGPTDAVLDGAIYATYGSGTLTKLLLSVGDLGSAHKVTVNGVINATAWDSLGTGTAVLNADNSSTLSGLGRLQPSTGTVEVRANGALGNTGDANRTEVNFDSALRFAGGVNYTMAERIDILGQGKSSNLDGAIIGSASESNTFGGTVGLFHSSFGEPGIGVGTSGTLTISGTVFQSGTLLGTSTIAPVTLNKLGAGRLKFSDTTFTPDASAVHQIDIDAGIVEFANGSTNSGSFDGYIGSTVSTTAIVKSGEGTFATRHVRVPTFAVDAGTFRILQENGDFVGGSLNTSVVSVLAINDGSTSTARLDIMNNDVVVDYTGTSPIGTLSSGSAGSGLARQIQRGYAGGSWNGLGINSSLANSGTYAIAYGEANTVFNMGGSGTATFSGQVVDPTSLLTKFTRYGDADFSGITDIDDYGIMASNFNELGLWTEGDFDYDGDIDIDDYGKLAPNFNETPQLRPVNPRGPDGVGGTSIGEALLAGEFGGGAMTSTVDVNLQRLPLYLAMLEHPTIYWGAYDRPDIWRWFAPYAAMDLGVTIPARPVAMRAIPEPMGFILAPAMMLRRRRRRVS